MLKKYSVCSFQGTFCHDGVVTVLSGTLAGLGSGKRRSLQGVSSIGFISHQRPEARSGLSSQIKPVILFEAGNLLLSHIVANIVPSAARVLTIVFGMGTGVSPGRIATRNLRY